MASTSRIAEVLIALLLLAGIVIGAGTSTTPTSNNVKTKPVTVAPVEVQTDAITIPRMVNYQGKLTDASGNPISGTKSMTFKLWDVLAGGTTPLWTETQSVVVTDGVFNVLLGSTPATRIPGSAVPQNGECYLEITVEGVPISPRTQLVSVPYAYKADTADYARAGPGIGGSDNDWVRGAPDSVLFTIHRLGIARGEADNALYGAERHTHVNMGTSSTTGAPGQNYPYCTVGGGSENTASDRNATVGGGENNLATGYSATVAGGRSNLASGDQAAIGGGYYNTADYELATVGGGSENTASGEGATVGGGYYNTTAYGWATVGGGYDNTASGWYATVSGGAGNSPSGDYATVSGGVSNTASGWYATVGGGNLNIASDSCATVGGGDNNTASDIKATVGGGWQNTASCTTATIPGGCNNTASRRSATVGGGGWNTASGKRATVGGGYQNAASGWSATVGGGENDTAAGDYSLAAGRLAKSGNQGCFTWGDATDAKIDNSGVDNRWMARCSGGVYFYTNSVIGTGSYLSAGGSSWNAVSDSMTKENFKSLDRKAVLERLAKMRLREYNLKSQDPKIRHVGPVAQDFYNAFGYGESNTAINMEDADGIALAAVQALYEELKTRDSQNQELQKRIEALEQELARPSK